MSIQKFNRKEVWIITIFLDYCKFVCIKSINCVHINKIIKEGIFLLFVLFVLVFVMLQ